MKTDKQIANIQYMYCVLYTTCTLHTANKVYASNGNSHNEAIAVVVVFSLLIYILFCCFLNVLHLPVSHSLAVRGLCIVRAMCSCKQFKLIQSDYYVQLAVCAECGRTHHRNKAPNAQHNTQASIFIFKYTSFFSCIPFFLLLFL